MSSIKNNQMECRECHKIVPTFNKYNQKLKGTIPHTKLFFSEIPCFMEFTGIDRRYEIGLCEDCCKKHFEKKWKGDIGKEPSRRFYLVNSMSKAAYGVPDDEYKILKQKSKEAHAVTLENLVRKYGEEEGKKKWDNYCKKQSETNTFEYKKEKYGWTKEQFDEYNASRAVTKKNLIRRWGKEEGLKKWNKYVDRQVETKSKDYVIEKYGVDYWNELCRKKSLNLETFIRKWGEEEGKKRWENYYNSTNGGVTYSRISKQCFEDIIKYMDLKYSTEFGIFENGINIFYFDKEVERICGDKLYRLDCYFNDFNIDIEFNGDVFHGNPLIYNENDRCNPFRFELTAGDIWEADEVRKNRLKKYHDIDILVIWEYDYYKNDNWTIENFIDNTLVPLLRKKNKLKNQNQ